MSKLLIFVGENIKFDKEKTIRAIKGIDGVFDAKEGKFIGAIFECQYRYNDETTIVRLSDDLETVTAEGLGEDSLDFALKLKDVLDQPVSAIDMDYSFHVALKDIGSVKDFQKIISSS